MGNCEFCMGKRPAASKENAREASTSNNSPKFKRKKKHNLTTVKKNAGPLYPESPKRPKTTYVMQKSLGLEKEDSKKDANKKGEADEKKPKSRRAKKFVTATIKRDDGLLVRGIVRKTSIINIDKLPETLMVPARKEKKKASKKLIGKKKKNEEDNEESEQKEEKPSFQSTIDEKDEVDNLKLKREKESFDQPSEEKKANAQPGVKLEKEEESPLGLKSPPQLIVTGRLLNNAGIISDDEEFKNLDSKKEKDDLDGFNSDTKEQETGNRDPVQTFWEKVKYRQSIKIKKNQT